MLEFLSIKVTGTHINSYYICPRQTWLVAHHLIGNQEDENLDYGRFLQDNVYEREKKEITIGHLKIDVMKSKDGELVIGEVKKSSASLETARIQLLFYLYELRKIGIEAAGELLFPEERRKERVVLDDLFIRKIEQLKTEIAELIQQELPPPPKKVKWCRNCSYREMCWA
ncbi:CRISPR-associated protein Cas4 [Tepidibacillus infernus]|uniref:CRISPR-associated protein Cas4 n=1 Tax=Tepidibacillus infernus TaxID=1806172 RepID=UPI003B686CAF